MILRLQMFFFTLIFDELAQKIYKNCSFTVIINFVSSYLVFALVQFHKNLYLGIFFEELRSVEKSLSQLTTKFIEIVDRNF